MPAIKYFKVFQTREVQVNANDIVDAIRLGDAIFKDNSTTLPDVYGRVVSEIKVTDLSASEGF